MNEIVTVQGLTMTSLEIAKLTGKKHSNILRDIDIMFDGLGMAKESQLNFEFAEQSETGEMRRFNLTKDLTLITGKGQLYFKEF